jgi:biopolymer transport protein ExbB
MKKLLISALLLAVLAPLTASAEWNKDWPTKNKVVVSAEGAAAAVADVPVVVRLHSGNFDFTTARPDGSDLRFIAADDKTELKYHIEKFDPVNELAVIWVNVPKADPKDKAAHFWIYSGNEKATATADAKGTFDAATVADFHFAEKTQLQDSSASNLTAIGDIGVQKAALLGEAAIFTGKPINIPAVKLRGPGFTWSAWVKPAAIPQKGVLFSHGDTVIKLDDNKLSLNVGKIGVSGGEIKAAVWQHLAVTVAAGGATLYINGAAVGNGNVAMAESQAAIDVGAGYTGEMDELQLANTARSADWIKLAASGQSAEGKLITVEAAAEGDAEEEGGTSYIGILVNNLTIDAKVVIGILAVMFAISTFVMIAKGLLISRTSKGNNSFLVRFRDARDDFLALDKSDAGFANSSIYHLYQAGLREIRKREVAGQQLALSGASLDAIKASVDAALVRENHRINANMVLLTIAISGGPFLGLLGTVVGVMITFAAIAAAGDVNINAIAPGIAAALLATVAGLGVAIPALFGYNYLASRIKNISADMQIFVDEFITRVAEVHSK